MTPWTLFRFLAVYRIDLWDRFGLAAEPQIEEITEQLYRLWDLCFSVVVPTVES